MFFSWWISYHFSMFRPQKCCTEFLATQKHAGCPLGVRDDIFSGLKLENHGNSWQNHGYHGFQWFQLSVSFPDISWQSLTLELQEMQIMGRVNQFEPKIENLVGVVCESSGIPQVAIVIKTHDIFGSSQMFRHTHTCLYKIRPYESSTFEVMQMEKNMVAQVNMRDTRPATRIPNGLRTSRCWSNWATRFSVLDKNISYIQYIFNLIQFAWWDSPNGHWRVWMECFLYIFLGFNETSFNSRSQTKSNSILLYIVYHLDI